MVKARLSEAEWDKIKQSSGIVENGSEAGRPQSDVVEPMAMPSRNPTKLGNMGEAKGGKMVGKMTEWKSHAGYDASTSEFEKNHPTLAKAVDMGKRVVGTVNKKTAEYVDNVQKSDNKFKEMESGEREEEPEEMKSSKKSKSKSKKKSKMLDEDEFDFDNEDEDITALHKSTSKQKILPGDYKSAYGNAGGISDARNYKSAFKSSFGANTYEPAYRQPISAQEGIMTPRAVASPAPTRDRFNLQHWQSMGFPNTLPQSARGALFRPAVPQQVVPMVRQPYQPTPQQPRAPVPMPRMGVGLFMQSQPTIIRPQSQMMKFAPPVVPRVATPTHKFAVPQMGLRMSSSPLKQSNINTSIDASHITILGMPAFKKRK